MPKIGAKLGFTLKLRRDSQYEFIRPEIEITDIDTEGDVTKQLTLAEAALKETLDKVTELSSQEILSQMGSVDQELQLQLQKKFKKLDAVIDELKKEVERLSKNPPTITK
jgi:hypothetical protein